MPKPAWAPGMSPSSSNSGGNSPSAMTRPATALARRNANRTTKTRPISATSVRHRHCAQREALACGEFLGRALELPTCREDVAAARRAHRGGVAGVENDLRELLDRFPVGALVS